MTERLTQRSADPSPRWVSWIPPLLLLLTAGVLSLTPPPVWSIPASATSLHDTLCRAWAVQIPAPWTSLPHLLLLLLLLQGGGLLLAGLLPPKSPRPAKTLAHALGIATLLIALTPWLRALLAPTALLPALTALVWAQHLLLQSLVPGKHTRAAPAGILAGLAAGLSLLLAPGLLPPALWLLTDLLRKRESAPKRLGFFLAGTLVGLLPFVRELPARLGSVSFSPGSLTRCLPPLLTAFGIGGLLLIALALLVGSLQKNRILLTFLLLTTLLLKAAYTALPDPDPLQTGTLLFFPALLCAYGIFRLLKGIESGIHAVNPAKARSVTLLLLVLLLLLTKLWALLLWQGL